MLRIAALRRHLSRRGRGLAAGARARHAVSRPLSFSLILGGIVFAAYALMHLGRAFSLMAEALPSGYRQGPYRFVRHPLYIGEAVSMLGLTLQYLSPLALAILAVQLAFQIARMKNEEGVLQGLFPEYRAYASRIAHDSFPPSIRPSFLGVHFTLAAYSLGRLRSRALMTNRLTTLLAGMCLASAAAGAAQAAVYPSWQMDQGAHRSPSPIR